MSDSCAWCDGAGCDSCIGTSSSADAGAGFDSGASEPCTWCGGGGCETCDYTGFTSSAGGGDAGFDNAFDDGAAAGGASASFPAADGDATDAFAAAANAGASTETGDATDGGAGADWGELDEGANWGSAAPVRPQPASSASSGASVGAGAALTASALGAASSGPSARLAALGVPAGLTLTAHFCNLYYSGEYAAAPQRLAHARAALALAAAEPALLADAAGGRNDLEEAAGVYRKAVAAQAELAVALGEAWEPTAEGRVAVAGAGAGAGVNGVAYALALLLSAMSIDSFSVTHAGGDAAAADLDAAAPATTTATATSTVSATTVSGAFQRAGLPPVAALVPMRLDEGRRALTAVITALNNSGEGGVARRALAAVELVLAAMPSHWAVLFDISLARVQRLLSTAKTVQNTQQSAPPALSQGGAMRDDNDDAAGSDDSSVGASAADVDVALVNLMRTCANLPPLVGGGCAAALISPSSSSAAADADAADMSVAEIARRAALLGRGEQLLTIIALAAARAQSQQRPAQLAALHAAARGPLAFVVPAPATAAALAELWGRYHGDCGRWQAAYGALFQAVALAQEAGDPALGKRALAATALASVLCSHPVSPLQAAEARAFAAAPTSALTAAAEMRAAFEGKDLARFAVAREALTHAAAATGDAWLRVHAAGSARGLHRGLLVAMAATHATAALADVAARFAVAAAEVEALLADMLLAGELRGRLDAVAGVVHFAPAAVSAAAAAGGVAVLAPAPTATAAARAAPLGLSRAAAEALSTEALQASQRYSMARATAALSAATARAADSAVRALAPYGAVADMAVATTAAKAQQSKAQAGGRRAKALAGHGMGGMGGMQRGGAYRDRDLDRDRGRERNRDPRERERGYGGQGDYAMMLSTAARAGAAAGAGGRFRPAQRNGGGHGGNSGNSDDEGGYFGDEVYSAPNGGPRAPMGDGM